MEHFVKKHKINTKSSMPKIHIGYANERLKENGKKQVVLIVYLNQRSHRFQTGVEISPIEWDVD